MYFSLGRFSIAFIVWSLLALTYVSQFHPIAIVSVVFVAISLLFRDKLNLGRKGAGVVCVASLLMCYACTRILSYDDTGMFLGIGTMSLTLLACWLVGVSLVVKLKGFAQRALLGFAAALLVGCSMTIYIRVVAAVALPAIVLLVLALREALNLKPSSKLILPTISTLLIMSGLAATATWSESKLSYLMGLFSLLPPAGYNFPTTTSLSALQRWNNSDIVVLRGYGSNPPLYLVGRTFSEFDDKNFWRWNTTKVELAPEDQMLVQTRTGPRALSLFDKAPGDEPGEPFRLEYPKPGNGLTLYYPRYYYGVAADINRLHQFSDGMLQALAKDELDAEYFVVSFKHGWDNLQEPPPLTEEEKEMYLQLPENLTPEVARLAEEVAGPAESDRQRADFVTTYFQQNFTYGYDFPFESAQTALEEFLLKRPPAHCEFFATSAALLLRSQGVPTRYINGFVLQEKSLMGNYYVIRLKHAHAWIEAYIPGEGWVTYDPTPSGTLGSPDDKPGLSQSLAEMASNFWRRFTNFFSLSPAQMLAEVKAFVKGLTAWDYLKLLALIGLWGLWKLYRRKRPKQKKKAPRFHYEPGRLEGVTPLLERLEGAISGEWSRRPSETPVAWVKRLRESRLEPDVLASMESFAKDYTRLRFSGGDRNQELARLNGVVDDLEKKLRER